MKPEQWNLIRNFSRKENWGDPDKMEFALLLFLDAFRSFIDREVFVTSGSGGTHLNGSKHYEGKAVDVVIDSFGYGKLNLVIAALRFPFVGVGVYPKWKHVKFKSPLGFHFDIQDSNSKKLWIGINEPDGFKQYELNEENLKHFGVV